ncbi:MAG: exodeoxyribonuclease V subunit alpha [Actinomycetota bacterium]
MNELRTQWIESEVLQLVFTTSDLLVGEALIRQARAGGISWDPSVIEVMAILLLVKATRLEHVALPLNEEDLQEQLQRDLWSDDGGMLDQAPSVRELIEVFSHAQTWHTGVCEQIDIASDVAPTGAPIVVATDGSTAQFVYLRRLAYAEDQVALELVDSLKTISTAFSERGFTRETLSEPLREASPNFIASDAVLHALDNLTTRRISVLTGGPGTGKTFTVAAFLAALHLQSVRNHQILKVARCAPTSKAAVRLGEEIDSALSGLPGSDNYGITFDSRSGSVQRLLKMHQNSSTANRELDIDLLIVDEVSMLDLGLLEQLLGAVQPHTHVLLVGDPNQLISVRVGAILRDIVELAHQHGPTNPIVTELTIAHRFGLPINELATAINVGDIGAVEQAFAAHTEELSLVPSADFVTEEILAWARELVAASHGSTGEVGIATLRKLSILCGTRMGNGSVAWWTKKIQMALVSEGLLAPDQRIPAGAPIMVTKNELRAGFSDSEVLSNGDVGLAVTSETGGQVIFGPSGHPRIRRSSEIEHFELGWSLTIHKSQGSDYEHVIVSLPSNKSSFVSRELLYTAVTRAKEKVTVIGTLETIESAIKVRANRIGGLRLRLVKKVTGN